MTRSMIHALPPRPAGAIAAAAAVLSIVLCAAAGAFAGDERVDCHDYAQPPESPIVSTGPLGALLRDVAADGSRVCWVEGSSNNTWSVLHWCEEGPDGELLELGSHRLRRAGVDYACQSLQVDGTRVIVYHWDGFWQIVDFANPAAPVVPWEAAPGSVQGLPALRDNLVYAPTAAGLALLELRDGEAPSLRSELLVDPEDPSWDNLGISRVALDGDDCWAIATAGSYGNLKVSLCLISCHDPDAPVLVGRAAVGWEDDDEDVSIHALAVDLGSAVLTRTLRIWTGRPYDFEYHYAILMFARDADHRVTLTQTIPASHPGDAAIAGDRAWVSEGNTVRYLERRDGRWRTLDRIASGLAGLTALAFGGGAFLHAGGPYTYGGDYRALVLATNLPAAWPVAGRAYTPDVGFVWQLGAVTGGLVAHVADLYHTHAGWMGRGIVGLNVIDPSFLEPSPLVVTHAMDTFTSHFVGDYAYTSEGVWDLTTRTRVNEAFPSYLDPEIFGASGSTLWGLGGGRLVSFDGTDPAAPARHGTYFPISYGYAFAGTAGLAYFAHADTIIATRLDTPHEPTVVARLVTGLGQVRDLALEDGRLYAGQNLGLAVFDIAMDGTPTLRGVMDGPTDGVAVLAPDGPVLYALSTESARLRVIDVGDPSQPQLIGEPGIAGQDLLLHGDVLYLMTSEVVAMRRHCSDGVPASLSSLQPAWLSGAATLTWNMAADLTAVRVLAEADGRSWVVPWRRDAEICRAVDERAPRGQTVTYAIQVLADGHWLTIAETSLAIPAAELALAAPAPNPFNAATSLAFSLDAYGPVEVTVVDAAGRLVRTLVHDTLPAGDHALTWRGEDDRGRTVAAGLYFVRLVSARGERVVKAALVK